MHRLILVAILVIAGYVRLSHLDLGLFMLDQARDSTRALAITQDAALPLVGPEVDGGPSHTWGPLYFLLLATPFALSPEPAHAAVFLALLNLLAVYLTYRLGVTFFGGDVGLLSAALFAADPGVVTSARAMWNLAPLPVFTLVFFYGLFAVVIQRRSSMIVLPAAALACLVQLHLATLSLAAVLALALVIYRARLAWPHLVMAAGVAFVLLLPFLVGQALTGFAELRALFSYSRAQVGLRSIPEILALVRQAFFASAFLSTLVGREFGSPGFLRVFTALEWTTAWLVLVGAVALVVRMAGAWLRGIPPWSPAMARYGLLALWIWAPFVVLGLKRGRLPWYYFDVLYPAPLVAAVLLLVDLARTVPFRTLRGGATLARGAVALFVALVVLVQTDFTRRWWTVTAATGGMPVPLGIGLASGMGEAPTTRLMPARYKRDVAAALVERVGADASALYVRAHGTLFQDLLEDKGFFFGRLSRSARRHGVPTPSAALHYALVRSGDQEHGGRGRVVARVGPLDLLEYSPLIDYQSWQYSDDPASGRWMTLPVPTRGAPDLGVYPYPPFFTWPQLPVAARGEIVAGRSPPSLRLIVVLREPYEGGEHRIEHLEVNGASVPPQAVRLHPTFIARDSETVFDLGGRLRDGRNTVTFTIAGTGRAFDLDVYELTE